MYQALCKCFHTLFHLTSTTFHPDRYYCLYFTIKGIRLKEFKLRKNNLFLQDVYNLVGSCIVCISDNKCTKSSM